MDNTRPPGYPNSVEDILETVAATDAKDPGNAQSQYPVINMISMPFGLTAKGKLGSLINSFSSIGHGSLDFYRQKTNTRHHSGQSKKHEKNKDIKEAAIVRAIVRLHERIKFVLGYPKLAVQTDELRDPYLSDFDAPYHLIQYCINSGIIDLLKSYKRRQNTKVRPLKILRSVNQ